MKRITKISYEELLAQFGNMIPRDRTHMFCLFSNLANAGESEPFLVGLISALCYVDQACEGYARMMLARISSIRGIGEEQFEALLQICAEIYVTYGAWSSADRDATGKAIINSEPGRKGKKNPEFEARANNIWYAIEVKHPKLIAHGRIREAHAKQYPSRLPKGIIHGNQFTPPRDNPIKDFLISADAKFAEYRVERPDAFRLLTIVWDDFVQEPVSSLLHPHQGLLTEGSFHRANDKAIQFENIDSIILVRYQHQLKRLTRREDLLDGELPMEYHHNGFPPKVLIKNPVGREIPDALLKPLSATRLSDCTGAEYVPQDIILWL